MCIQNVWFSAKSGPCCGVAFLIHDSNLFLNLYATVYSLMLSNPKKSLKILRNQIGVEFDFFF